MSPASRPARRVVGVALGVAAGVWAVRRLRLIREVAPELRSLALLAPIEIRGPLSRAAMRVALAPATRVVRGVSCRSVRIPGGLDAYLYEPEGRQGPTGAVLYTHGGGTIAGRPEAMHASCSSLARDLGMPVLAPRYRLAPAHPFPAALDDVMAALRWLLANAAELGVDPARLVAAGDSAGGLLAASVAQRALDEGVPVAFQALIYPMLDDRTPVPVAGSDGPRRGVFMWTGSSGLRAWRWYLGREADAAALAHAVPARRADLSGLPPTWIGVGELDLFLPESLDYAARLRSAGVEVEEVVVPGMYHAADVGRTERVPIMTEFRRSMIDAILRAVG